MNRTGRRGSRPLVELVAWVALLAIVAASCSSDDDDAGGVGSQSAADGGSVDGAASGDDGAGDDGDGDGGSDGGTAAAGGDRVPIDSAVPVLDRGEIVAADLDGPSVELVTLQEDPYVGAAVYPRPDYEANPWSQWGQGIALGDGRVITAIGDHLGADANSYLYVYDPEARTLTQFADILSAIGHEPGSWGYGKIHSQMVDAGDGGVFFTTYYGSRRGINFGGSYDGDVLFRLDQATLDLQPITVPAPGHGVPSLATNGQGLIYGEAVDPLLDEDTYPAGGFFVYDATIGDVQQFAEDPRHEGFRNVMVDPAGTAWFAADGGGLFRYDPATEGIELTDIELPANLRASTLPDGDGTIYGITAEPWYLFAFEPDGSIRELGQASWYATSLALTPDQASFLYVPGAHGDSWRENTPVRAVDVTTGEQTDVVQLLDLVRDEFDLTLGGTYSITIDAGRNHAHIGFNAGPTEDSPWGEVVFVVVELP